MMGTLASRLAFECMDNERRGYIDSKHFFDMINGIYFPLDYISKEELEDKTVEEASDIFYQKSMGLLEEKQASYPNEVKEFLKVVLLRVVDTYWMDHIDAMSELRQAVRLQAYAQINPLREYQELGFQKFEDMVNSIEADAVKLVNRAQIRDNLQREEVAKPIATNAGDDGVRRAPAKSKKVGRNDPCPCGSGKKYKNCCGV